jgi:hypothetical protein
MIATKFYTHQNCVRVVSPEDGQVYGRNMSRLWVLIVWMWFWSVSSRCVLLNLNDCWHCG